MDTPSNKERPLKVSPDLDSPRRPASRRAWPWVVVLLLLAVAVWWLLAGPSVTPGGSRQGAGGRGGFDPNRPTPVATATAKTGDINIYLHGLGTVTPLNTVTVRSRVEGELTRVLFREGQVVKAGDLLAEIDPRPFQVQLAQAEGQLARDLALLKNAQADLERYRVLFEQDSIARQQLDTQAALVRQYEGTIQADRAQIDDAKLQLAYSRITAPIGGRLGLRQVDPGNIVRASDANGLVVITQLQPIAVVFTLPEDNLPAVMKRLTAGDRLAVDAFDRGGKTLLASGTLLTVDNQIDSATGTIKLKAEFPNDDYGLFPNQFVNARLLLETRRAAVLIPSTALLRGASTLPHGGSFVYVVNPDNTVSVRPVRPGATEGEMTAIEDGLAAGEVVVTDGTDRLREGAKIQVAGRDAVGEQGAAGPASPRARESAASPPAGSEREQGESRGTTDNPPSRQP